MKWRFAAFNERKRHISNRNIDSVSWGPSCGVLVFGTLVVVVLVGVTLVMRWLEGRLDGCY